jgi:aerobic-type carbon monoxide dehydrogenase small subunit (CoxS/CutS family)
MAARALLDEHPDPTDEQIREAMLGNLCRCTGYYGIIAAIRAAARAGAGRSRIGA